MQVQSRRQSVAGNEEEDSPSTHGGNSRGTREADAAFWQLEWKVMSGKSGGDKTCHFLCSFSPHNGLFLSDCKIIWTGEEWKWMTCHLCMGDSRAAAKRRDSDGSQLETETHWCEEKCQMLSRSLCTSKFLLAFSRPLENLKHWKIIFCWINKEASSQMGIFMETNFRHLLKPMFPSKF